jgi:hypothetical protein
VKFQTKLAVLAGALAISAVPALAAAQAPSNPGTGLKPSTPGPGASLPTKAKAYGFYCQGESKKHVEGQKGTPFSQCVTAMAKLANGITSSPREACKNESKKHVEGQKGTPFSKCVAAGAKLLQNQSS